MQTSTLNLIHELTVRVACGPPHGSGVGPYGAREYYEIISGEVEGARLNGKLIGSGSDWMIAGPDGFMRMDVRVQIETNDGAIIFAHYFGHAEANEKLIQSVISCKETQFSDHSIRSHWVLETGDSRYAWVNQSVFVGRARLAPASPGMLGFEHQVYCLA